MIYSLSFYTYNVHNTINVYLFYICWIYLCSISLEDEERLKEATADMRRHLSIEGMLVSALRKFLKSQAFFDKYGYLNKFYSQFANKKWRIEFNDGTIQHFMLGMRTTISLIRNIDDTFSSYNESEDVDFVQKIVGQHPDIVSISLAPDHVSIKECVNSHWRCVFGDIAMKYPGYPLPFN
jgi:hypothetical protein